MIFKCIALITIAQLTSVKAVDGVPTKGIAYAFKEDEIVPDIIDTGPLSKLTVSYGGEDLEAGAELTPLQSVKEPEKLTWEADPKKFYILFMLDPDAISRKTPIFRSFLHWAVGNIPGNKLQEGVVLSAYRGPGPPKNTGLHRYVFLVYEQPNGQVTYDPANFSNRPKYSIRDAITKLNLSDPPVAGNYFQCKNQAS